MDFFEAKRFAKACLGVGFGALIVGFVAFEVLPMKVMVVIEVGAVALLIASAVIILKYCRCPLCGERLFRKALSVKRCPYCGKSLNEEEVRKELARRRQKAAEKARAASEKARAEKLAREKLRRGEED